MTFETQGYIDLPLRISEERLKTIRKELSVYANSQTQNSDQSAYGILRNNVYLDIAILRQTLDDYNLGRLACDILDIDEVILFQDNLIWKPHIPIKRSSGTKTIPIGPCLLQRASPFGLPSTTPTETMVACSTSLSPTTGESVNQPTSLRMTGISRAPTIRNCPHIPIAIKSSTSY